MHPPFSNTLADLLRAELAGYGGLLALFDRQQAALLRRDAQAVADNSLAIEHLAAEASAARAQREHHVALLAADRDLPPGCSLRRLLALFPADQRPLFEALIDEINRLLQVIRRRSQQNHAMLARAVEIHRDIIATLRPDALPRTYAPPGRRPAPAAPLSASLQATG